MDRKIISLVIFIFAISVFADVAPYSETTLSPSIWRSPLIPLLGSQQAPSANSTEGPAGRPNLELVPLSTGSINSLSPAMMKSTPPERGPRNKSSQASGEESEVSRKVSSPLPGQN